MQKNSIVDYRKFRFSKLNTPEFEHLKYLAYWPIFGLFFLLVERVWIRDYYSPVYCPLDDFVPFCEFFLIPYLFWFVFLIGMTIYTLLFDTESFKRMMSFIIVSYSAAIIIYMLFPNCQNLRPAEFTRDNVFTRFVASYYSFDTNTNVCPSLHVIGSVAAMFGAWHSKHFSKPCRRIIFAIIAFLISISTVFLKQHSVIDILAAVPVCVLSYAVAYIKHPYSLKSKAMSKNLTN